MADGILDYLPREQIIAAFERSPGNELASGKLASPESSAALAANTFGLFLNAPGELPPIPNTGDFGWPALTVAIERCAPFPWWPRGRHPWLDAFVETKTHIIGVESKRYEPYRAKGRGKFSKAYWRPVWGKDMVPFEAMRDDLAAGKASFAQLDAVQLVKHAFGLVTEAARRGKQSALLYLFAEPDAWPSGKRVDVDAKEKHVLEVERFAGLVAGAAVKFRACTYRQLLDHLKASPNSDVVRHAQTIDSCFQV